jgi:Protein of unknown function (DUF3105)
MKLTLLLAAPLASALALSSCSGGGAIADLKTFSYKSGDHKEGLIKYTESPPTGGPHNNRWQKCGVYTQPLYNQYAVHSMEHGAVWITYQPSLPAADVAKLKAATEGRSYTLLSPYAEQTAPVVASAWNAQVALKGADDPRIKDFLAKYEQSASAPEPGAACDGPASTSETQ